MTTSLSLLGPFEVVLDGRSLTKFRTNKVQALLIYLVVEAAARPGAAHRREALMELLWPGLPLKSAQENLRQTLYQLRKAIPELATKEGNKNAPFLLTDHRMVQINPMVAYELDIATFTKLLNGQPTEIALEQAMTLYRGDFLVDFYLPDSDEFETWASIRRAELRRLALDGLDRLTTIFTEQGAYDRAESYVRRQLQLDNLRESAHRQMMLLLTRSGQRSAALVQYETCRRILAEELEIEPAAETTLLYERIRAGGLTRSPALPPFLSSRPQVFSSPAPFVARQRELGQLEGFLDLALAGQGRVIFVAGDAGSGKTMLVQEFSRRAQEARPDLIVAGGSCNAQTGIGDPYLPFRQILALLTGDIDARWEAGTISREHARRLWALTPHSIQALLDLGSDLIDTFIPASVLVSRTVIAEPDGSSWLAKLKELVTQRETGQVLKQIALFEQYIRVLQALTRQGPLLLALDDLQWADTGSISLLFHLGRQLQGKRILIVGLYRPADVAMGRAPVGSGYDPSSGSGVVERHPLEPVINEFQRHFGDIQVDLDQADGKPFVEMLLDTEPNNLGSDFRGVLYQHTKGHALFTVEIWRGMQERGDLIKDEQGRWVEGPAVDWETMPTRVEGIIRECISRLSLSLQDVLKVASVEGEDFIAEVAARVKNIDESEIIRLLSGALDKQHHLVQGQGSRSLDPGGQRLSHYRFRHSLFQRYLYHSLDEVERIYLHEAVGKVLEQIYGEQTEETAVQLARHFQIAGRAAKAIGYLRQAGERAARLSANEETIGHLNKALALLKTLFDTPEYSRQELELQIAMGNALVATRGYAAPEVGQTFSRAWELCRQMAETPQLFPALHGLHRFYFVRAELQTARQLAERLLSLAQRQQEPTLQVSAHRTLGATLWCLGEFGPALDYVEQGFTLYDPRQHHTYARLYGQDEGVACLSYAAWVLEILGYPDRASKRSQEALRLARELAHPYSLTYALNFASTIHLYRREVEATLEQAEAAIALATRQRSPTWLALGICKRGWALIELGRREEGLAQMEQGLAIWRATGAELGVPYYLVLLAEGYGQAGRVEEALTRLAEAMTLVNKTGERFHEAELYRVQGELLLKEESTQSVMNDELSPEGCFLKAIEIARRQEARSLELRATASLSRLWQRQGKKEEARRMLVGIYDWFSEGFDTVDLQEAKALLEVLQCN